MEGEDEMTGSCIDDRHLPSFPPVSPIIICLVPRGLFPSNTQAPAHKDDTSRAQAHRPNSQRVTWGHQGSKAVRSMCKVAGKLKRASLRSRCLLFHVGHKGNTAMQSSGGNTFLTSAILSFLEAGFSLVSGGVCWDFEPVDSLSDSD